MSVEPLGASTASRMARGELPALIGPEILGRSRNEEADPGYLCLIGQVAGQLVVWDLGGKDGTLVNGSRVKRATLKDCDTLGCGGTEFRVHREQPPGDICTACGVDGCLAEIARRDEGGFEL